MSHVSVSVPLYALTASSGTTTQRAPFPRVPDHRAGLHSHTQKVKLPWWCQGYNDDDHVIAVANWRNEGGKGRGQGQGLREIQMTLLQRGICTNKDGNNIELSLEIMSEYRHTLPPGAMIQTVRFHNTIDSFGRTILFAYILFRQDPGTSKTIVLAHWHRNEGADTSTAYAFGTWCFCSKMQISNIGEENESLDLSWDSRFRWFFYSHSGAVLVHNHQLVLATLNQIAYLDHVDLESNGSQTHVSLELALSAHSPTLEWKQSKIMCFRPQFLRCIGIRCLCTRKIAIELLCCTCSSAYSLDVDPNLGKVVSEAEHVCRAISSTVDIILPRALAILNHPRYSALLVSLHSKLSLCVQGLSKGIRSWEDLWLVDLTNITATLPCRILLNEQDHTSCIMEWNDGRLLEVIGAKASTRASTLEVKVFQSRESGERPDALMQFQNMRYAAFIPISSLAKAAFSILLVPLAPVKFTHYLNNCSTPGTAQDLVLHRLSESWQSSMDHVVKQLDMLQTKRKFITSSIDSIAGKTNPHTDPEFLSGMRDILMKENQSSLQPMEKPETTPSSSQQQASREAISEVQVMRIRQHTQGRYHVFVLTLSSPVHETKLANLSIFLSSFSTIVHSKSSVLRVEPSIAQDMEFWIKVPSDSLTGLDTVDAYLIASTPQRGSFFMQRLGELEFEFSTRRNVPSVVVDPVEAVLCPAGTGSMQSRKDLLQSISSRLGMDFETDTNSVNLYHDPQHGFSLHFQDGESQSNPGRGSSISIHAADTRILHTVLHQLCSRKRAHSSSGTAEHDSLLVLAPFRQTVDARFLSFLIRKFMDLIAEESKILDSADRNDIKFRALTQAQSRTDVMFAWISNYCSTFDRSNISAVRSDCFLDV